jgi:hypothetical protein
MRFSFFLTILFGCSNGFLSAQTDKDFPKRFDVTITNPLKEQRSEVFVEVSDQLIRKSVRDFNTKGFIVMSQGREIPSQYCTERNGRSGVLFVLEKLDPLESREISIMYNPDRSISRVYPKRTQAELSHKVGGEWKNREYIGGHFQNVASLRVPPEHKDHSWFIRYEGPGWESDKVGYRFYLDQRNAVDVFGKKVTEPVLQVVGQDNFDSYHEMRPWGMDVLKVGKSLGLGSIGTFHKTVAERVEKTDSVSCGILENGVVYASLITQYFGWKVETTKSDVTARTSIHAGSRLSSQELTVAGDLPNICSGIVKDQNAEMMSSRGGGKSFGYIATFGKQSLNDDNLGLVVFFDPSYFLEFTEDQHSHIVVLKPKMGRVRYYFAAAWQLEATPIATKEEFRQFVEKTARELANPVVVKVNK